MPVQWTANPPNNMAVDADSVHDFRVGQLNQTYYGLVHVINGTLYLVAGAPVIKIHRFVLPNSAPDFRREVVYSGPTDPTSGQGGHGSSAMRCGILMEGAHKNLAGFSITKIAGDGYEARFRSGYNSVAFTNNPIQDDTDIERLMPATWCIAISACLDATL